MDDYLQPHANVTDHRANSLYLGQVEKTSAPQPDATLCAATPDALASTRNANDDRGPYDFSIEDAERYILDHGYEVASRTISHYCQRNTFRCKKFTANGVRRWFVQKDDLDNHIEQMRRDGHATVSERKQTQQTEKPLQKEEIAKLQEDPLPTQATATANDDYRTRYIEHLEEEVNVLRRQVQGFEEVAKGLGAVTAHLLPSQNKQPNDDHNPEAKNEAKTRG